MTYRGSIMQLKHAILVISILLLFLTKSPLLSAARIHQIANRSGIAMIRTNDGNCEIWQLDASGQKQKQLVPGFDVFDSLRSPDQKTIAILAKPSDSESELNELYLVNHVTGKVRKITERLDGYRLLAWRPGTSEVLISRDVNYIDPDAVGDGGDWLVDLRTGKLRMLIEGSAPCGPMTNKAAFDPSGNRLAVLRSGQYPAVLDLRHPNRWWRLPFSKEAFQDVAWIDSNRLAIATVPSEPSDYVPAVALRRNPGGLWIWDVSKSQIVPPQGQDLREVFASRRGVKLIGKREIIYSVAVSPSGRSLVYVADSGLYVVDTRTLKYRRLLHMADMPHSKIAELRRCAHLYRVGLAEWLVLLPAETYYLWEFTKDESHVYLREAGEAPTPRSIDGMPRYLIDLRK